MSQISIEELRTLFLFEALTDEQLTWIADRGDIRTYDEGTVIYREGEPAEYLFVLLTGMIRSSRLISGEDTTINKTDYRGSYIGAVRSFVSEQEHNYAGSLAAVTATSMFRLPSDDFITLMKEWFPMSVHLLEGIYFGVRNSEAQIRQREHLAALGTLSANLAHELNNPAAATVRATEQLRGRISGMRKKLKAVVSGTFDKAVMAQLIELQDSAVARAGGEHKKLTPMQQSDLEDEISDRLDELGVPAAFELAPIFANAALGVEFIDEIAAIADTTAINGAVHWIATSLDTEALLDEIDDASHRISTLVAAVKLYSHMDQATHQDVAIEPGLDSTVVMLGRKLSEVEVIREYDEDLPQVPAYAAELNQVWTNLIDNAVDAMGGHGKLWLRTSVEGEYARIEVADNGPGIPAEIQSRIYDAFFTTKPPGAGSGLGLDNAQRIVVKRHRGKLDFQTGPNGTTFVVKIPLQRALVASVVAASN